MVDAKHALAEFSEFVKREDSSVLPAMEAIAAVGTSGAAAELLGRTNADFCRMRSRPRVLSKCFQMGERVPRRRRSDGASLCKRLSTSTVGDIALLTR